MHIYFHSLLWSYLPRVPTILTTCVYVSGKQDKNTEEKYYFFVVYISLKLKLNEVNFVCGSPKFYPYHVMIWLALKIEHTVWS